MAWVASGGAELVCGRISLPQSGHSSKYGSLERLSSIIAACAPSIVRGKDIIWRRAAPIAGRPYLARAAEEHSGPHMPWFWRGDLQGGGVLNDMMCHSVEVARYMLTEPGKPG